MEITDHLTCLWETCKQVNKQQFEVDMEQKTASNWERGIYHGCILSPFLFNFYPEKEESEKFGLKLNIQKTKIMASGPIISWQIDGETMETVTDFIFGGSKITDMVTSAMKLRHLLLGRKVTTPLNSLLKSKDITLPTKSI